jgi:hypothetical protein
MSPFMTVQSNPTNNRNMKYSRLVLVIVAMVASALNVFAYPQGVVDDLAVTVGLGALELSEPFTGRYDPVIRGTVEVVKTPGLFVGGYPTGTICGKFPSCWDRGPCECYGCLRTRERFGAKLRTGQDDY